MMAEFCRRLLNGEAWSTEIVVDINLHQWNVETAAAIRTLPRLAGKALADFESFAT